MRIPPDRKFSCIPISFSPKVVGACGDDVVEFGDGAFICLRPPFEWDDHWVRWIGELQTDAARDSNCFLLVAKSSSTSSILDQENHDLSARVQYLLWALFVHGVPAYEHGIQIISGGTPNGEMQVRQVNPIQQFVHPRPPAVWVLDDAMVASLRAVHAGLAAVAREKETFGRLRRCINAWSIAAHQHEAGERTHNFVRVLNGLLLASDANAFANRARAHLDPKDVDDDGLRAMFRLRNQACHLGEWKHAVGSVAGDGDPAELADLLTSKCERLAMEALLRALGDPELRAGYETEASAREFVRRLDGTAA